eukprot:TRINITY_DN5424_c0_g1_i1.p1 TRINITY_DN5424_c0_g1~~TRINITY_DN5424_c0_g1_i1.p1  ORF type:complete len:280 (-),score=24.98 TRINITY_DN5424_c0_g1_i1:72-911(-)
MSAVAGGSDSATRSVGSSLAVDNASPAIAELLAPLGGQLTLGSTLGFCAGAALRTVGRAAAVGVGSTFCLLQVLAYRGYIQVDWRNIERDYLRLLDRDEDGRVTAGGPVTPSYFSPWRPMQGASRPTCSPLICLQALVSLRGSRTGLAPRLACLGRRLWSLAWGESCCYPELLLEASLPSALQSHSSACRTCCSEEGHRRSVRHRGHWRSAKCQGIASQVSWVSRRSGAFGHQIFLMHCDGVGPKQMQRVREDNSADGLNVTRFVAIFVVVGFCWVKFI